jgi:hypothetical protein
MCLKESIFFIPKSMWERKLYRLSVYWFWDAGSIRNGFDVLFMLRKKRNQNIDRILVYRGISKDFSQRSQSCVIVGGVCQETAVRVKPQLHQTQPKPKYISLRK